jgi:hypothetical protein
MATYQEEMEANPEEIKAKAEHQESPKEEVPVETIGALEDRSGNQTKEPPHTHTHTHTHTQVITCYRLVRPCTRDP